MPEINAQTEAVIPIPEFPFSHFAFTVTVSTSTDFQTFLSDNITTDTRYFWEPRYVFSNVNQQNYLPTFDDDTLYDYTNATNANNTNVNTQFYIADGERSGELLLRSTGPGYPAVTFNPTNVSHTTLFSTTGRGKCKIVKFLGPFACKAGFSQPLLPNFWNVNNIENSKILNEIGVFDDRLYKLISSYVFTTSNDSNLTTSLAQSFVLKQIIEVAKPSGVTWGVAGNNGMIVYNPETKVYSQASLSTNRKFIYQNQFTKALTENPNSQTIYTGALGILGSTTSIPIGILVGSYGPAAEKAYVEKFEISGSLKQGTQVVYLLDYKINDNDFLSCCYNGFYIHPTDQQVEIIHRYPRHTILGILYFEQHRIKIPRLALPYRNFISNSPFVQNDDQASSRGYHSGPIGWRCEPIEAKSNATQDMYYDFDNANNFVVQNGLTCSIHRQQGYSYSVIENDIHQPVYNAGQRLASEPITLIKKKDGGTYRYLRGLVSNITQIPNGGASFTNGSAHRLQEFYSWTINDQSLLTIYGSSQTLFAFESGFYYGQPTTNVQYQLWQYEYDTTVANWVRVLKQDWTDLTKVYDPSSSHPVSFPGAQDLTQGTTFWSGTVDITSYLTPGTNICRGLRLRLRTGRVLGAQPSGNSQWSFIPEDGSIGWADDTSSNFFSVKRQLATPYPYNIPQGPGDFIACKGVVPQQVFNKQLPIFGSKQGSSTITITPSTDSNGPVYSIKADSNLFHILENTQANYHRWCHAGPLPILSNLTSSFSFRKTMKISSDDGYFLGRFQGWDQGAKPNEFLLSNLSTFTRTLSVLRKPTTTTEFLLITLNHYVYLFDTEYNAIIDTNIGEDNNYRATFVWQEQWKYEFDTNTLTKLFDNTDQLDYTLI